MGSSVFVGVLASIWFKTWAIVFWVYNLLKSRKHVTPIEDQLLLSSASALAAQIRARQITSLELVEALIKRIEKVEPVINSVVIRNFDSTRDEATKVDRLLDSGKAPSAEDAPFLGVPFTLKDCINIRGLRNTAGIPARANIAAAEEDAESVRNLRKAGAIGPLAVTNVSEVCMWWESNNGIFGRTLNPYDTRKIVGGSSGGEAALLCSGGSVFGIGSDIGGSIRMPAFFNGIFGHKPSKFVLSDEGSYPPVVEYQIDMHSQGPLCRFAEDLQPMLIALGGPATIHKLRLNEKVDVTKVRIFYMEGLRSVVVTELDAEMRGALRKAVNGLEKQRAKRALRVDLPLVHLALPMWLNDMEADTSLSFREELAGRNGQKVNPYWELMKLVVGQSVHTVPALALAIFEELFPLPRDAKPKLTKKRELLEQDIAEMLGDNGVLLFPSHPTPAPFHNQPIAQPFNWIYTGLFNSVSLPVTQVPLGLSKDGVPLGVQVVAALNQDRLCLAVARELEHIFGGWVNPGST